VQRGVGRIEAAGWIETYMPGGQDNMEVVLLMPSAGWTHYVHSGERSVTRDVTCAGWTKNTPRVDIKRVQSGHLMSTHKQTTEEQTGARPKRAPLDRAVSVERVYDDNDNDEIPF
jgi:hypothetical protein